VSRLRTLFRLHRTMGLLAAMIFLVLVGTGLLLNHTETLHLNTRYVPSRILQDWYGIATPANLKSYAVNNHWITESGGRLYFDASELPAQGLHLVAAVALPDMIVVALDGRMLLLTFEGEVIEALGGAEGVPAGMKRVGSDRASFVVQAAHGYYHADRQMLHWKLSEPKEVVWAQPQPLPDTLREALVQAHRGKGLSWERVLLDMHSGRILGRAGVWLVDLAAIVLLYLVLTGVWMWIRLHRR
jgi:hypothetical protein